LFSSKTLAAVALRELTFAKTRIKSGDVLALTVTSASGQSVQASSFSTISAGVWYHVAAVRGNNFIQLYLNGALEGQASVNFPQDYGNLPLYFGSSGQSYWDHKLAGSLDEVTLYNRNLTPAEIASIYASGTSGKCKTSGLQNQLLAAGKQSGSFVFTLTGQAGHNYSVESSSNLVQWTTITNLTLTNGSIQISRPMVGPKMFFRSKQTS